MKARKHLNFSLEAIHQQDGKFFQELVLYIKETDFNSSHSIKTFEENVAKCAHTALGFSPVVQDSKGGSFYIYFHWGSANNAVLPSIYRDVVDTTNEVEAIKKIADRKSIVDLKKSRLTGVFSTLHPTLYLDYVFIRKKVLSPEELAAVILHEYGHYFTAVEMLDRTVCSNLVLNGVDRALRSGVELKKREMILEAAGKALSVDESVISDLKKSSSDTAIATVLLTEAAGAVRSENELPYYDLTTMEFLADQFATRHGAGRHLVTGLDKLYQYYGHSLKTSQQLCYWLDVLKMACAVVGTLLGITLTFSTGSVFGVLSAFMCSLFLFSLGSDELPLHNLHDERAKRIRRDLIDALKSPAMKKDRVIQTINDIKAIDSTIKDYYIHKPFMQKLFEFVSSNHRNRAAVMKFQQELESLAMNDLFLAAAELKHAS